MTQQYSSGGAAALSVVRDRVRVHQSTAQAIGSGAYTALTWPTPDYDTNASGMYSAGTPTLLTVRTAGCFRISGSFGCLATGGTFIARLILNGTTGIAEQHSLLSLASSCTLQVGTEYVLNVGDTIALQGFQGSGGTVNTLVFATSSDETNRNSCFLGMTWIDN